MKEPVSSALPQQPVRSATPAESPQVDSSLSSTPPPAGGLVLQVAAMSNEENAKTLMQSLRQKSLPAFVFKRNTDHLFKVFVGPYVNDKSLGAVKDALKKDGMQAIEKRWSR